MNKSTINYLENKKHIHFIGIGGSGMFPLAQILHSQGYFLTGSDNNETDTVQALRNMGINVVIGQKKENIQGADLIVHTAAIMEDNEELIAARASQATVIERAQLLGMLTHYYSNAVCISGTHGKTTTSSMTTKTFLECGLDPTVVIGGKLKDIGGSGRLGTTDHMVVEACEFKNHFHETAPDIAVILNIEEDHMEFFKTIENVIKSFHEFAASATKFAVVNGDDPNCLKAVEGIEAQVITFGATENSDYYPKNITKNTNGYFNQYDLYHKGQFLTRISLSVPGDHNVLNSVAAAAATILSGGNPDCIAKGLESFHGAGRRFEVLAEIDGVTFADDYAHHPAEIKVTLEAAKNMHYKRVWAVHQPFTYSRTKLFLNEFAETLSIADFVVLSEIMGSREKNTLNIFAKDLAEKIEGCVWFPTFPEIAQYVLPRVESGDLVITLGCGDVNKCAHLMVEMKQSEKK